MSGMNNSALFLAAAIGIAGVSGCDGSAPDYSGPRKIRVYSGGTLIHEGVSKGSVKFQGGNKGLDFVDECIGGTNKTVEVSGDVVITRNDLSCPKP
ncbi:MAG TPA: hypothetical protein PKX87_01995 [Alphaproteobacteria bacterium]|nr:hypothetical protein [Alphaproteobacteria bacterium]